MADSKMQQIYDKLKCYMVPQSSLGRVGGKDYKLPCMDFARPGRIVAPSMSNLQQTFEPSYKCNRCSKTYAVGADGMPVSSEGCVYHENWWHATSCYSCCKRGYGSAPCKSNAYHVHRGELLLANYEGFVEAPVKSELEPNKHGVFAIAIDLCYTPYGFELIHVTIVDAALNVVYDKLVCPTSPILDYLTSNNGISASDLASVTTRLADVQRDLMELLSSKSILVGHSLEYALMALKLAHKYLVDTSILYPHRRPSLKKSLKHLVSEQLGMTIQDCGHDSVRDARAVLRLACHKAGASQLL